MSVPTMPGALVAAPPRTPLPFGLFSTLTFRDGEDRWLAGVDFETPGCGPLAGSGHGGFCADPETVPGMPRPLKPTPLAGGTATPFSVYADHYCSPVGNTRAALLAAQRLLTGEEAAVERIFWTGELGNTPTLAGATVIAEGVPPTVGVALLEEWIAATYGSQGVIHTPRSVAGLAGLKQAGLTLRTPIGTPVAAGTGYPGTGPDGTPPGPLTRWVYATPAVTGYRSDVSSLEVFDPARNDLLARAERDYLLMFEDCGTAAVHINLTSGGGLAVDPDNPDMLIVK